MQCALNQMCMNDTVIEGSWSTPRTVLASLVLVLR